MDEVCMKRNKEKNIEKLRIEGKEQQKKEKFEQQWKKS